MAGCLVEEGNARIQLQRRLITELQADTGSPDLGEELLATLEAMQIHEENDREGHEAAFVSEPATLWRRLHIG